MRAMAEAGFEIDLTETASRGMPALVKPLVYGRGRLRRAPSASVSVSSVIGRLAPSSGSEY